MSGALGSREVEGARDRPPTRQEWRLYDVMEATNQRANCPSYRGPFACTLDKGHQGPHVGHGGQAMGVWALDGSWGYKRDGEEF